MATCRAEVKHRGADFARIEREQGLSFDRNEDARCEERGQYLHEGRAATALIWLSHLQTHESLKNCPFNRKPWRKWAPADRKSWLARRRYLWSAYDVARDAYSEADEERTLAAVGAAQQRILMARTLDPEGNAIKLKVIAEHADRSPGLLDRIIEDLSQPHPAPSPVEFCRAISVAAPPQTEECGEIKSKAGLADALIP